jgi:hypothetical protein
MLPVMEKIDFVLPWVDGLDPKWQAEKKRYAPSDIADPGSDADDDCRFRDFGLLRYWFRAVERFAPWANKIFFVTCGQKPEWLDESHPKLRLVDHREYIPEEYLPTFNSNTIELNLHRLTDLSEQFVLFNDDMYLLRPMRPEDFFKKGLPVIPCDLAIPRWIGWGTPSRVILNNAGVLKRSMDVEHLVWKNMGKFTSVRHLGLLRALKNVISFAVNRMFIPGTFGHLPLPHLKSTFEEIWRVQPRIMDMTSRSKFRSDYGVNHWMACAWNMLKGRFHPVNEKRRGIAVTLTGPEVDRVCRAIVRQSCPEICINDAKTKEDIFGMFAETAKAFGTLLPERSSFEKNSVKMP